MPYFHKVISLDWKGPRPKNFYVFVFIVMVIYHFTKYAFSEPIRDQEAATIKKILMERIFPFTGLPRKILTDRGSNFESHLFKELCHVLETCRQDANIFISLESEQDVRTLPSHFELCVEKSLRNPIETGSYGCHE